VNTPAAVATPAELSATDQQRVIDELDRLLADIAHLLQRFEDYGLQAQLKEDYLALHELQAKALLQRQAHALPTAPAQQKLSIGPYQ
jgi:hypothetical protein